MKIFNCGSRGIIHDENNSIDRSMKHSAEEYYQACSNLDPNAPDYKHQINLLKKQEAKKRIKILWDANCGIKGFILKNLIIVSCLGAFLYLSDYLQ